MATNVIDLLGGAKVLGSRTSRPQEVIDRVRAGLPYRSLELVIKAIAISREETSRTMSIPDRTLARRRKERKLSATESDRLFRIARIVAHAANVFGSVESAAEWLRTPNLALGGAAPLGLLDTDPGALQVDEVLARIEFGVYSLRILMVYRDRPDALSSDRAYLPPPKKVSKRDLTGRASRTEARFAKTVKTA